MTRTWMFAATRGAFMVGALAACGSPHAEVRRYSGTPVVQVIPLTKGDVAITNRNGSVWVDTAGTKGKIAVIGRPFAGGANNDAAEQAAIEAMATLKLAATTDANGDISVIGGGD